MKNLYKEVMKHDKIYSLMYSPGRSFTTPIEEQIISIRIKELEWASDRKSFRYVWGWPGPCFNIYDESTYGKGWAFTKEEILKAWENKEG